MEAVLMARKKTEKPKEQPADGLNREELVAFRCKSGYKRHLEEIAREETRTPTQIIERALKRYAEENGHKAFPER